jgi:hypothetical protein
MSRNYESAPQNFAYCLNEQCSQSANCLRFQARLHIGSTQPFFSILNPLHIEEQKECSYFRSTEPIRCASGMKHLYDNLPHLKAIRIKSLVNKHFSITTLHRIKTKERLIKPEEIAFIRSVFIQEGITEEPLFDEYIEVINW